MYRVWNTKSLEVVTEPVNSPVSLALVKTHLRVDGSDEDTLIQLYIDAATKAAEDFLKRALITQTLKMTMDGFNVSAQLDPVWSGVIRGYKPDFDGTGDLIKLWRAPVQSVSSVTTISEDNTSTVFAASNYELDEKSGRLFLNEGSSFPTGLRDYAGVEVRYIAGYGNNPEDVPQDIRMAILTHVEAMYNRCGTCGMPKECMKIMGGKRIVTL